MPGSRSLLRSRWLPMWVVLAASAVLGAAYWHVQGSVELAEGVLWWCFPLGAAAACTWRGLRSHQSRWSWLLLAAGAAVYAAGDITWDVVAMTGGDTASNTGTAFYQGGYVIFAAALWRIAGRDRDDRTADQIDTLLVLASLGCGAFIWLWEPLNSLDLNRTVLQVETVTLLLLVVLATLVWRTLSSPLALRIPLVAAVAGGVGLIVVADVSFFIQGTQAGWDGSESFTFAGWDYVYFAGWTMLACAAVSPQRHRLTQLHEWATPTTTAVRTVAATMISFVVIVLTTGRLTTNSIQMLLLVLLMGRLSLFIVSSHRNSVRQQQLHRVSSELGVASDNFLPFVNGWLAQICGPDGAHLCQQPCEHMVDTVALGSTTTEPGSDAGSEPALICLHRCRSRDVHADALGFSRMLALAYGRETMRRNIERMRFQVRLSSWLEHTSDALLAVNNGTVEYASPGAAQIFPAPETSPNQDWPVGQTVTELGLSSTVAHTTLPGSGAVVAVDISDLPEGEGQLWTVHDISEYERLVNRLHHLAYTDSLTGVPNRGAFVEALRTNDPTWIGIVDIDDFKTINDSFGHDTGDEVLRQIAARLTEHPTVTGAFRLGGDEFAVFLEGDADSFVTLLDVGSPVGDVAVSVTVGVSPAGTDALKAADAALYAAKRAGKGRLFIFGPGDDPALMFPTPAQTPATDHYGNRWGTLADNC